MAQFSHPDFGGMSQWSPGMSMVGEMFNTSLKSKLDAVCTELAAYVTQTASNDQGRSRDDPESAIVQRGRAQIGGRLISEHPVQLAHKMTFSMQFSPALGDWQSKTANVSRFTILANIESSAWLKRKA